MDRFLSLKGRFEIDGQRFVLSTVGFKGSSTEIVAGLLPPFETMLFAVNEKGYTDYNDLYCECYYSEEEAIRRHGELLEKAESGEKFWKEGDGE
ncbi:hypothetical protein [uncultured Phascolarctobacterium sp.]|uniref:hypothetical protein n=1 Tax=uncultured Phascolarctobacterium sp. TaxID=512296 RepID=UPI0025DEE97D|nr:hypothetical protein [uncultured Phascolarctobacterium sp.]